MLKHTLTPKVMKSCPTMYETLTVLKELPAEVTAEEFLVSKVLAIDVDEPEMKREHKRQLAARAKTSQNQQQRPRYLNRMNSGDIELFIFFKSSSVQRKQ